MEEEDAFSAVSSSNLKTQNDTKTETSGSSNCSLRPYKRLRQLNNKQFINIVSSYCTSKYKGVVQQQNGHWGAQIYANHRRIWLGTFKSKKEAAMAYDSASIKLRSGDSSPYRNFPWTDLTIQEPDFQECYTPETVLNMIRDGSYQSRFRDFLTTRSEFHPRMNRLTLKDGLGDEDHKYFSCLQLFQKELTPSDVGKLNRLVIPKKYAVKYLPYISESEKDNAGVEDVELVFYDRLMRPWKFRYCYWRSSQSFVFTRGWNRFVKEKNLKEKDVVTFYTCEGPNHGTKLEGQSDSFQLIDINYFGENGFLARDGENLDLEMNLGKTLSSEVDKREKRLEEEIRLETRDDEMVEKRGFMLFGAWIS